MANNGVGPQAAGDNTPQERRDPLPVNTGRKQVAQQSADQSPPAALKTVRQLGRNPGLLVVERASVTETAEETDARMLMAPAVSSSFIICAFGGNGVAGSRPVDATMAHDVVAQKMAAVNAGDLTDVEGMMMARACALEAVATEYMRRASLCLDNPQATETYMRMALKADSQCRSYLEAIAEIKNPRPVFAKQTNIANGPQQVNNAQQQQVNNGEPGRAENSQSSPNKLLPGKP